MSASVSVSDLHYAYPDGRVALAGVDLEVPAGQRMAVIGANGAGKSTLALHINGILSPAQGTVSVGGVTVEEATLTEIRRRVGFVFQDSNDQLFMPTVEEDVAFGPANSGVAGADLEETVSVAMRSVGVEELRARPPHHLSGGEKRRAAVATVLAMAPDVLVLDEPSAGLDPRGRRDLLEILQPLDATLIVVTHDLALALELCPMSAVMAEGRIVAKGPTVEILGDEPLLEASGLELPLGLSLESG